MKVGDTVPVTMSDFTVAEAVVEDISDGKATLLIPATRVVMGVRTSLTDLPEEAPAVDRGFTQLPEGEGVSEAQEQVNDAPPQRSAGGTVVSDDIGEGLSSMNLDSSVLDD